MWSILTLSLLTWLILQLRKPNSSTDYCLLIKTSCFLLWAWVAVGSSLLFLWHSTLETNNSSEKWHLPILLLNLLLTCLRLFKFGFTGGRLYCCVFFKLQMMQTVYWHLMWNFGLWSADSLVKYLYISQLHDHDEAWTSMGFFACSMLSTIYIENILCGLIGLDLFILTVKTNDMMLVIYLSSLIRSVIALHNLINNKVCIYASISCIYQVFKWSIEDGFQCF